MPHLSDLWSEIRQERQDVVFLAVDAGDPPEVIREWWEEEGFTLTPVMQEGYTVSEAFGVQAYPTNYILGPDGRVLWRRVGFAPGTEEEMRKVLASTAR